MGNPQLTDIKIGWLSGIIDGEGSITMGSHVRHGDTQYMPRVSITNSDPEIIWETIQILEALGCTYYVKPRVQMAGHLGKREMWDIAVFRFEALEKLLTAVIPWLHGKKAKGMLMLSFVCKRLPKINKWKNCKRGYTPDEVSDAENVRKFNDCTRDSEYKEKIQSVLRGNPVESGRNDQALS